MPAGKPVGTAYGVLDLDFTKMEQGLKRTQDMLISGAIKSEDAYKVLGTHSAAVFDQMRVNAARAADAIVAKQKVSLDMTRADLMAFATEETRVRQLAAAKIAAINEQQYGKQNALASASAVTQTSFIDGLKSHWIAASAIIATAGIAASKVWSMAKVGAGFEEQQGMLDNLSRKYGTTADTIVAEMDRAAGFQVAKSELMSIALGGIAKGLRPEQLINLANAAETLGDAVGKDATTALRDLTEALETGRTKGLKNYLGTTLDLETAFGGLESKMTAAEKAQAMYSMTMMAAIEIQKNQTKETDNAADKIAQVEKKFDDATLAASRFAKSVTIALIDSFKATFMSGNDAAETLTSFGIAAETAAVATNKEIDAVKATTAPYQAQIDGLKKQLEARKDNEKAVKDLEAAEKKRIEYIAAQEATWMAFSEKERQDYWAGIGKDYDADQKKWVEGLSYQAVKEQEWIAFQEKEHEELMKGYADDEKEKIGLGEKRLAAERNIYKDLRGYDSQYYDASTALINKQAETYRKLGISEVAVDAWVKEEHYKAERAKLLATGTFIDGVKVGLVDLQKRNTTFAQAGEATMTAFAHNAEKQLSDNFFNVMKGNFNQLEWDWTSLWDSMLQVLADRMAKMAVEAAVDRGISAAGKALGWLDSFFGLSDWLGLAVGEWMVQKDKLALVHQGEMIVPEDHAKMLRDLFESSGGFGGTEASFAAGIAQANAAVSTTPNMDALSRSEYSEHGLKGAILGGVFGVPGGPVGVGLGITTGMFRGMIVGAIHDFANRMGWTEPGRTAGWFDKYAADEAAKEGWAKFSRDIDAYYGIPDLAGVIQGYTGTLGGPGGTPGGGLTAAQGAMGGPGGEPSGVAETSAADAQGGGTTWRYGGISRGPDAGYWAKLHGTEAVVPLPGGRSIPVQVSGGAELLTLKEEISGLHYTLKRYMQKLDDMNQKWDVTGLLTRTS